MPVRVQMRLLLSAKALFVGHSMSTLIVEAWRQQIIHKLVLVRCKAQMGMICRCCCCCSCWGLGATTACHAKTPQNALRIPYPHRSSVNNSPARPHSNAFHVVLDGIIVATTRFYYGWTCQDCHSLFIPRPGKNIHRRTFVSVVRVQAATCLIMKTNWNSLAQSRTGLNKQSQDECKCKKLEHKLAVAVIGCGAWEHQVKTVIILTIINWRDNGCWWSSFPARELIHPWLMSHIFVPTQRKNQSSPSPNL